MSLADILTVFNDGLSHSLTPSDNGMGIYHAINSTTIRIEESSTSIASPNGVGESNPAFLIENDSQIFIAGRDISIMGSNGNDDNKNGGAAIRVTQGSSGYFENYSPSDDNTFPDPIRITGGMAFGSGNGGDALHFDGAGTEGTISGGDFLGGLSNLGTPGNALRVSNNAEVSILGGNFLRNIYVDSGNVKISNGIFQDDIIIATGEGSVLFENSCFNFTESEEDEGVIYARGYFVTEDELGSYQEIATLSINGGLVEKTDHPDCDSLRNAGIPPQEAIVFDDGESHSLVSADSGTAFYHVLNSTTLVMKESLTYIIAPRGLGEETPTFQIDTDSQLFITGGDKSVTGSEGSIEFPNGGPAIRVMSGGTANIENNLTEGSELWISGGLAFGGGNVGGDAIHFDGAGTEGTISGGLFQGGPSISGTTGSSLRVSNSSTVFVRGGEFIGNVFVESSGRLGISSAIFQDSSTEVMIAGEGSVVVFENGCFGLTQSEDDEGVVYMNGYFLSEVGELGPYWEIIVSQIDGGLVESIDDQDCDYLLSSSTSPLDPLIFDDGGSHDLATNDSGIGLFHVTNASTLRIEESPTSIIAPVGVGGLNPAILVENYSQLFVDARDIHIRGSNGTTDNQSGGVAVQVIEGSRANFSISETSGGPILIIGGDAFGTGVGGDAIHFDGQDTKGSIVQGVFVGGDSNRGTLGNALRVSNSADVSVHGGEFIGNLFVESSGGLEISNAVFQDSSEVMVLGEGSVVIFKNGCFNLTKSYVDDEVMFVTGNFLAAEGGLGPFQNITTLSIDGGLIGRMDHPDCVLLLNPNVMYEPTASPTDIQTGQEDPDITSGPTALPTKSQTESSQDVAVTSSSVPTVSTARNTPVPTISRARNTSVPTISRARNTSVPAISAAVLTSEPTVSANSPSVTSSPTVPVTTDTTSSTTISDTAGSGSLSAIPSGAPTIRDIMPMPTPRSNNSGCNMPFKVLPKVSSVFSFLLYAL